MKTKPDKLQIDFKGKPARPGSTQDSRFKIQNRPAFTLIELLIVISIIAVLAAFVVPVLSSLKRKEYINKTQAEMGQIETAIERYKAAYGIYPPSNPNNLLVNQLYYELVGTTNDVSGRYATLDGRTQISGAQTLNAGQVPTAFGGGTPGVNGFLNCSKPGAGEDAPLAKTFLPDLKSTQIGRYTNSPGKGAVGLDLLIGSVGGPDQIYRPLNGVDLNPWRYNSSNPTNNPGSYDLWIQLSIGSTTNTITLTFSPKYYLICNWSKQVQFNSPLP